MRALFVFIEVYYIIGVRVFKHCTAYELNIWNLQYLPYSIVNVDLMDIYFIYGYRIV